MRKNLMLIAGISTLTSLAGPLLPAASATSGAESARYVINQPTEITITKVYFGTSWLGLTYNDINNKYEGKHVARVGVYSGEISDSLLYTQAYGIASAATTEDKENLARSITSDDLILVYLGQPPFNMMDKLANGEEWFWHVDETHIGTLTSSRMSYFVELKRDIYDASEEPDIIIGKIDYGECRWAAGYNHGMSCRPEYHSEDDRYHYWMYDIGTNEPVLPRPEVELYKYDEKDDSGDNTGGDSGENSGGSGDNTGENNGDNGGGTGGDSGDNNPDDGSGNNTGGDTGSNGEGNSGDNGDNNPDDNTGGDGGNTGDNNNPDDGGENGNGGENNDPSDGGNDNSGENTPSDPTNQPTTGDDSKTPEDTTPPADTPSAPSGEPTGANSGVADAQDHTQNPNSGAQSSNSDTDTTNSGTQNPNSGAGNATSSVKTADSAANAANSEFASSNTGSASGNTNSTPVAATFASTPVNQDGVWRRVTQDNGHTAGNVTNDGDTDGNTDGDSTDAETADSATNIASDNDATDANIPLLGGPEEHQGNKLWWVVPVIIAAVLGLVSLLLVFPLFKRRKQNKD